MLDLCDLVDLDLSVALDIQDECHVLIGLLIKLICFRH